MFYPEFFPLGTEQLAPDVALDAEASLAWMFVTGDRGFFRHIWDDLEEKLAHELCSLAFVDYREWNGLTALLRANAEPMRRFIQEQVLPSERHVHWEWQQPDWEKVRERLGEETAALWKQRFADNEEDGRRRREEELAAAVA
jgi:hypothetical protein